MKWILVIKKLADGRYRKNDQCRFATDADGKASSVLVCFNEITDFLNFDENKGAFIAERGLGTVGSKIDVNNPRILEAFSLTGTTKHIQAKT